MTFAEEFSTTTTTTTTTTTPTTTTTTTTITTTIYLHSHIHRWCCIKKKEKNDRSNYTTIIYKVINSNQIKIMIFGFFSGKPRK